MILERGKVLYHRQGKAKRLVRVLRMHTYDPGDDPTPGPIEAGRAAIAEVESYRVPMPPLGEDMESDRPIWRIQIAEPEGCLEEVSLRELMAHA